MKSPTNEKFNHYYAQHCKHLKLKGLQPKTIDACSRAIRRIGAYFDGDLENLSREQLLDYFCDLLERLAREKLSLPKAMPHKWVVDCKRVGSGDKALIYLGRYLYRGVIREKDILSCRDGKVTYRYQDSHTKRWRNKTVSAAEFLWLVLQHVLPKGFRRARNSGFLHPDSKGMIRILQRLHNLDPKKGLPAIRKRPAMKCPCCGGEMAVQRTRIPVLRRWLCRKRWHPFKRGGFVTVM